jgi:hypothetical protein
VLLMLRSLSRRRPARPKPALLPTIPLRPELLLLLRRRAMPRPTLLKAVRHRLLMLLWRSLLRMMTLVAPLIAPLRPHPISILLLLLLRRPLMRLRRGGLLPTLLLPSLLRRPLRPMLPLRTRMLMPLRRQRRPTLPLLLLRMSRLRRSLLAMRLPAPLLRILLLTRPPLRPRPIHPAILLRIPATLLLRPRIMPALTTAIPLSPLIRTPLSLPLLRRLLPARPTALRRSSTLPLRSPLISILPRTTLRA